MGFVQFRDESFFRPLWDELDGFTVDLVTANDVAGAEALRTREEWVLHALRMSGATSRGDLCQRLGISRTAMSLVTTDLIRRGAVVVVDTDAESRTGSGRPAQLLALDPSAGHYIGIDFRHRDARVVVADASHTVIARGSVDYPDETGWSQRIDLVQTEISRLMRDRSFHLGVLQQIGIGVPGPVLLDMLRSDELPQTQPASIASAFEAAYGVPVLLDNNVRLAALGEANAKVGECRNLLFVRIGIGVGAGLVLDGQLAVGARRLAGEIGHAPVAGADGACRCANRGCLETVASVPAILRACGEAGVPVASVAHLADVADDPRVVGVLNEVVAALVAVLTPVMLTSDPDEIVLAGDLFRTVPWLVGRVGDELRVRHFPSLQGHLGVRADELGDDGGAIGALHALFRTSQERVGYVPTAMHSKGVI